MANNNLDKISKHYMFLKYIHGKHGEYYSMTDACKKFKVGALAGKVLLKEGLIDRAKKDKGFTYFWKSEIVPNVRMAERLYNELSSAHRNNNQSYKPKSDKPKTAKKVVDIQGYLKSIKEKDGEVYSMGAEAAKFGLHGSISPFLTKYGIIRKSKAEGASWRWHWRCGDPSNTFMSKVGEEFSKYSKNPNKYEFNDKSFHTEVKEGTPIKRAKIITANNKETTTKKYENNMKNKVENLEGIKSETYFSVLWGLITFHKMKHN